MTLNVKGRILDNGLIVYHFKVPSQIVSLSSYIFSGSYFEKSEEYGISHFIEHLLFKGTNKRKDRSEIYEEMKTFTTGFICNTDKDRVLLSYNLPKNNLEHGLEFMTDLLFNSRFDKKEIEKEKEIVIREIKERYDNVNTILYETFFEALYPNTPLCLSPAGTEEIIKNLDPKYVKEKYKNDYNPANMVLFVASPFRHGKIFSKIKKYFKPYERLNRNEFPKFNLENGPIQRLVRKKLNSLYYGCGKHLDIKSKEKIPIQLATQILSDEINDQLLNKQPLSYSRSSSILRNPYTNSLFMAAAIDPKNMNLVRDLVKSSIKKIQKGKFEERRFLNAKKQNQMWHNILGVQSLTEYGFQYWYYDKLENFLNYPKDLNKTTLEEVIKTAKKHLKTDRLTEVFIGDFNIS